MDEPDRHTRGDGSPNQRAPRPLGAVSDKASKPLPIWRGTTSSNPLPSSGESDKLRSHSALAAVPFADARLGGTPHLPGTREYFTCLEGRVEIVVAGQRHDLDPGDVLAFPGNTPHSYHNPDTRRPASGVSVVILAKAGV